MVNITVIKETEVAIHCTLHSRTTYCNRAYSTFAVGSNNIFTNIVSLSASLYFHPPPSFPLACPHPLLHWLSSNNFFSPKSPNNSLNFFLQLPNQMMLCIPAVSSVAQSNAVALVNTRSSTTHISSNSALFLPCLVQLVSKSSLHVFIA